MVQTIQTPEEVSKHTNNQESSLYQLKDGLLFLKDRIYVLELSGFRTAIIHEFHSTLAAGHSGLKPTICRLSALFLWPGMYKEVKQLLRQCVTCQQNKYLPTKKPGLLQPLSIPNKVWDELTMDFVTHLPNSFGHIVI